jgi:hypothetical protein
MIMKKVVPPQLGVASFSCPHCGAFTHQTWFKLYLAGFDKKETPSISRYDAVAHANAGKIKDGEARERAEKFFERLKKNSVTYRVCEHNVYSKSEMVNVWLSLCYTCDAFAVWVEDKIVYPIINSEIMPHEDMPGDVRDDFNEAALIVDQSPRGAAALLRLAIQKLMPHLKQKGKDLNAEIGALVKKGLGEDLAKAMDVLRVVGNNAVHPGQIDLKDDKATALKLFDALNLVIERLISTPKKIEGLFQGLPKSALGQIEKRDKKDDQG